MRNLVAGSYVHVFRRGASIRLDHVELASFCGSAFSILVAIDAGRIVAYMGSKRKVSKSSRTTSIVYSVRATPRSCKEVDRVVIRSEEGGEVGVAVVVARLVRFAET